MGNQNCSLSDVLEQSGTNVTAGYVGSFNTTGRTPRTTSYREGGLCPVNVHWHWGAEHLSVGQYDEDMNSGVNGPTWDSSAHTSSMRLGKRCNGKYASLSTEQKTEYKWKYCKDMKVGETYEVHWPHSTQGACGTAWQYQSPFYYGVFCRFSAPVENSFSTFITNNGAQAVADNVGVQGQVFTVVNDDRYYYPNLIDGWIQDGDYGSDIAYYTGSTTGTSRNNEVCSMYSPITWQVDRKCHFISASSFDKMCADMLNMPADMSSDVHAHGAREIVSHNKAADNHQRQLASEADNSDICGTATTTAGPTTTADPSATTVAGGSSETTAAGGSSETTAAGGSSETTADPDATTGAPIDEVKVKATLTAVMTLPANATGETLLADTTFKTAAEGAIATANAVPANTVEITGITLSDARRALAQKRRLSVSKTVSIDYTITVTDQATLDKVNAFIAGGAASATALETAFVAAMANVPNVQVTSVSGVTLAASNNSTATATSGALRSLTGMGSLFLAAAFSGFDARLSAFAFTLLAPGVDAAGAQMYCKDLKTVFDDMSCCGASKDATKAGYQIVPRFATNSLSGSSSGSNAGTNTCAGKKPAAGTGYDNFNCTLNSVVQAFEQSGTNVTYGYVGTLNRKDDAENITAISTSYFKVPKMCPVNVHWHWGAEHLSVGQYDYTMDSKGPEPHTSSVAGMRRGLRCNHYDASLQKFNDSTYKWKHCVDVKVGETYEVHWPHSAFGACGTPNQYQHPFYDGVLCGLANPTADVAALLVNNSGGHQALASSVGVQGQVFTIVNDESYYFPNLIRGMLVSDGAGTHYGQDMTYYTGSTTGTSRSNELCSAYAPITWQVDRKCHLISASSFDKMCADMKQQRDDMSGDLHPHGAREIVSSNLAANNHRYKCTGMDGSDC